MTPVDRRREILDEALGVFSSKGYHNTSMNEVAEAVKVTKPVVYQHFDSKRALYIELLHDVADDLVATVTKAAAGTSDPREQTERGMVAYFRWVSERRDAFSLLFESSERVDEEFAGIVAEFENNAAAAIAPLITADVSPADQATFAVGLVGMAETVSRHVIASGRDFDPETLGRTLAALAWGGLRSLGSSRRS